MASDMLPKQGESRFSRALESWKEWLLGAAVESVPPTHNGTTSAWIQVLASFLFNVNIFGLVYSFGTFQEYYEKTILKDKSSSTIAWIGTAQAGLVLLVSIFSGAMFDKGWMKLMQLTASIGLVFALMMLSLSTRYYQLMLTQGILAGICGGLLYVPSVAMIVPYFTYTGRRGLALGLGTSGGAVGAIIYPFLLRRLLNEVGFPWATRTMGFLALVTLATATSLARSNVKATAVRKLIDPAVRHEFHFLAWMFSSFIFFAGVLTPFFLTPAFAVSLGASADTAFYLVAVLNAAQAFGRVLPAFAADYIGAELMMIGSQAALAILAFAWISIHSLSSFVVFIILWGFFSGLGFTLPAVVMPHVCPSMAVYGSRVGMVYACAGLGSLIGVPIATATAAATHGWLGAQLWTGACIVLTVIFFIPSTMVARRKRMEGRATAKKSAAAEKDTETGIAQEERKSGQVSESERSLEEDTDTGIAQEERKLGQVGELISNIGMGS